MGLYLITYTAGADPGDMTDESRQEVMAAWMAWYGTLGENLVDYGNPTMGSKTISPGGGVADGETGITGYSLINADSLDAAAEACASHPHLEHGGTLTVHETFQMGPDS